MRRLTGPLGKKKVFEPVNRLEETLTEALEWPERRLAFYKELVASELLLLGRVVGPFEDLGGGYFQTGENTKMQVEEIDFRGGRAVLMFSSLDILKQAVPGNRTFVRLSAKAIFEVMGRGTTFLLNPYTPLQRVLTGQEVESLLDGSIFNQGRKVTIRAGEKIFLSQPAKYPHLLVKALVDHFQAMGLVERAYLAQAYAPSTGQPPHLLVGIKWNHRRPMEFKEIADAAGAVAIKFLTDGEFVEFTQINAGRVSEYMINETKPFYEGGQP